MFLDPIFVRTLASPPVPTDALLARRRAVRRNATGCTFAALLLWSAASQAQSTTALSRLAAPQRAKLAPHLSASFASGKAAASLDVIVSARNVTPESLTQAAGIKTLPAPKAFGFSIRNARVALPAGAPRSVDHFGHFAARLTATQVAALARDSRVLHISPDLPIAAHSDGGDGAVQTIGANTSWTTFGTTGQNVSIAILDTGVAPHADLTQPTNRIVGWADFVNGRTTPYDDNGHGTHVAGIAAGNGYTAQTQGYNTSLARTAPGANIVGVKVLDASGQGVTSQVLAGVDWVIAHKDQYNIRVLNISLGHGVGESYTTDPLCQACERAWFAGITVVVAAGNNGRSVATDVASPTAYGTINSPGNDPLVLTVGAMNTLNTPDPSDDRIATYSSRGPSAYDYVLKPDLVAPGNLIQSLAASGSELVTTYPENLLAPTLFGGTGDSAYYSLSGTSMASPFVAGAAALLAANDPTLTPDSIKARLMVTATKITTADPFTYGAGYLNIPAAISTPIVADPDSYALSSTVTLNPDNTVSIDNFHWGNNNFHWGNNNFHWGNNNFHWGNNSFTLGSDNFIWGSNNFHWGNNNFIWGNNNFHWGNNNFHWGTNSAGWPDPSGVDMTPAPLSLMLGGD